MAVGRPTTGEVRLVRSCSPIARVAFGSLGIAIVVVVLKELWPALRPIGWQSLVVLPIVVGGVAIGSLLLVTAVLGEHTTWVVSDASIEIFRRSAWENRRDVVPMSAIAGVDLNERDWETLTQTFGITIRLANGKRLISPDCASKEEAERLRDKLLARRGSAHRLPGN